MSNIPVVKFLFQSDWQVLGESLKIAPAYQAEVHSSANELATFLSEQRACLVITSLRKKEDLVQLATIVKLSKKVAKDTVIKYVVVNFSGDKQYEKTVAKLGILDFIEEKVNTKGLRFKVDFYMKSLNAQIKNNTSNANAPSLKTLESNKTQDKKAQEQLVSWTDPLNCKDDMWLVKNEADCKKVLSKWLVKLMGPSPYLGQWVEKKAGCWKFVFKEENPLLMPELGTWYFQGDQKPEFIWKENLWLMTGNNFQLFYNEKKEISRLWVQDKSFFVCRNSEWAKSKEKVIIESFDKEVVFKNETLEGEDESIEQENEKIKNLEGKAKTDVLNQANLSGAVKGTEPRGDHYSGQSQSENLTNTEEGKLNREAAKKSAFWNGKNRSEEGEGGAAKSDAPHSGKMHEGKKLEIDAKGEHEKFYHNHNPSEQFGGKDQRQKEGKQSSQQNSPSSGQKDSSGTYGGNSSTDKLQGHLKSPQDSSASSKEEQKNQGQSLSSLGQSISQGLKGKLASNSKDAQAQGLAGATSEPNSQAGHSGQAQTDKLPSHLKSSQGASLKGADGKSGSGQGQSDGISSSQKGGTDSSLKKDGSAGQTQPGQSSSSGLNGKGQTDKLPGHLKSPGPQDSAASENDEPGSHGHGKKGTASSSASGPKFVQKGKAGSHNKDQQSEMETKSSSDESKEKNSALAAIKKFETQGSTHSPLSAKLKQAAQQTTTHPLTKQKEKSVSTTQAKGKLLSLEDKRNMDRALAEDNLQVDPELEEACQTAKVVSIVIQNKVHFSCNLDDHFDRSIIFSTSETGLSSGKKVSLDLTFIYLDKITRLNFDGEVKDLETSEDGMNFLTVELSETDSVTFGTFMKLYLARQKNVDVFLKRAKGF